ncbi:MAG: hypothetical protein F2840_16895 [Actinobacteria bacterium]|nr:hypothetical protein [Actinomycetota bacterium]
MHVVRTLEDSKALQQQLVAGQRLAVIGAGFIGCEVAATARGLGRGSHRGRAPPNDWT